MKDIHNRQWGEDTGTALDVEAGAELCFGKYKLLKVLGQGGFGITYMGLHTGLGKTVAIKEYFPKDVFRRMEDGTQVSYSNKSISRKNIERFLREARTMAGLRHDNIVSVTDVFEENNTAYYVMDYVEGRSLEDRGRLNENVALKYVRQVADALKYIHSKNILHLDIKPANIMIDSSDRAVLIDFGISKHYDKEGNIESSTTTGYSAGYSPVEQMTPSGIAQFSPSTDIYALGATIYKITSGTTPPVSTLLADGEVLTKPADMSERLFKVVSHCMQVKRRDRPQSIDEFLALLGHESGNTNRQQEQTQQTQQTRTQSTREQTRPASPMLQKKKKNVPAIVVFSILGAVLMGFLGFYLYEQYSNNQYNDLYSSEVSNGFTKDVETIIVNGVSFNMVKVEGGTFDMGSNNGYDDEKPVHSVTLSDYYIGQTEVTQELWQAIMGTSIRQQRDKDNREWPIYGEGSNYPMYYVSWNEVQEFISRLNSLTGKQYRLPTEAEWEYAARGGKKSKGYKYSGSNFIEQVAWYSDNSGNTTHPVGSKQPNELGIYDMSGNVWEWCYAWYGAYNSRHQTNPTGPASGSDRVLRGGSWDNDAVMCWVSSRGYYAPDYGICNFGFRLAL